MKNFDWTKFTRQIAIKAPIESLYEAWTKSSELEQWFLKNSDFFSPDQMEKNKLESVKPGDSYRWSWYMYDVIEEGTFIEANGKDLIRFTFAGDCLVEVRLEDKSDYTLVELTQKNIPTDEDSKKDIRLGCDSGWSFYLVNLKSVFEGGLDLRNKEFVLKVQVNN